MPRFDGTGPSGQGPKTGRGMGPCSQSKLQSNRFGRGRFSGGMRKGLGRNWDKKDLEDYRKNLEDELVQVKEKLEEK